MRFAAVLPTACTRGARRDLVFATEKESGAACCEHESRAARARVLSPRTALRTTPFLRLEAIVRDGENDRHDVEGGVAARTTALTMLKTTRSQRSGENEVPTTL